MAKLDYQHQVPLESLGRHVVKRVLTGMLVLAMGVLAFVCVVVGSWNLGAVLDDSPDRFKHRILTILATGISTVLMLLMIRWGRYCLTGRRGPKDQITVLEVPVKADRDDDH